MQIVTKIFIGLVAAIVGACAGFFIGLMASFPLAPLLGITSFEGAAGYFAVYLGLLVGLIGFVAGLCLPFILSRRARKKEQAASQN